jgi:hypothetical protein
MKHLVKKKFQCLNKLLLGWSLLFLFFSLER